LLYQIHLYVPKTGKLTPSMIDWLYQHGTSTDQPEVFWPVRKLRTAQVARIILNFDPTLLPEPGADGDVTLHYPLAEVGLRLYIHTRGVIVLFPFTGGMLARVILGIAYTYIRFLSEQGGFWSFDPQLNTLLFTDDLRTLDETAELMESVLPKLLEG
jgi:hypothetical protein